MRKRLLSAALCSAMVLGLLAGCGSSNTADTAEATTAAVETAEEGKVFNIYAWNDEFQTRVQDYYPGYEVVDGTTGKIGDVTVKWNITPSDDNAYQNNLDENLLKQADAADDDKIDMFLIEADYAVKYVDTEYTKPIADLGITDDQLANQYQYTKDIVTDSDGVLKGVSWQGCPGVLIYNREIAKDVLGTDDPEEVQKSVADWDTFQKTAADVAAKGYYMTSSVNDSYRVFSNNVTSPWVVDGKINIDDNLMNWVDLSKEMVDANETDTHDLWSDDWSKGFYQAADGQDTGKVFCYFGPAWFVDFCMHAEEETSIAANGGWAATEGPQGFFWGGTWVCAAEGTDNASLVKSIIETITVDTDTMKKIVTEKNDFVNNKPAMEEMAADPDYQSAVLGGQNPLAMYCAGADNIEMKYSTAYDQTGTEEFQNNMKAYFMGDATKDEAIAAFKKAMIEKHPELSE